MRAQKAHTPRAKIAGANNPMVRKYGVEGAKAHMARIREMTKGKSGRKAGVPDGYTKEQFEPLRVKAREEAKRIVATIMASEEYKTPDDQYAKEALEAAVEIVRTPGSARERLQAAKVVLEYTKTKPAQKIDATIKRAEDFLDEVASSTSEDDA